VVGFLEDLDREVLVEFIAQAVEDRDVVRGRVAEVAAAVDPERGHLERLEV